MNDFTERHFRLLEHWQGQVCERSDPEHAQAYEELAEAYALTEDWARRIQERLFPQGGVKALKKPTDRLNRFMAYNWARIYPAKDSSKHLAYTVGIGARDGFRVKIDTYQVPKDVRGAYERLRGPEDSSPIVAMLPRDEGLTKALPELVQWAVEAIEGFGLDYGDVKTELERHGLVDHRLADGKEDSEAEALGSGSKRLSLNTILYGPPGTGKTWGTVRRCVEICDGEAPEDPEELRERYQQLLDERRLEFVTFHQSYGYEEFVEGIRPVGKADGDGGIQLTVKPGVLKRIAERARRIPDSTGSRRVFKMTIPDPIFAECMDGGFVLLKCGGDVDWSEARFKNPDETLEHWQREIDSDATWRVRGLSYIWQFRAEMRPGDIVVVPQGLRRFRAVGVISGDYEFRSREDGYHHYRAVDWHWHVRDWNGEPVTKFMNWQFAPLQIHKISPSNPAGLLKYLHGASCRTVARTGFPR